MRISSVVPAQEQTQSGSSSDFTDFCQPRPPQARAEHSARLLDALDLTVRVTGSASVAVIERAPGRRAVRFVCGIGGLASSVALDDVLWLVAELGGGTQSRDGVTLVPFGTHHAVVMVGTDRELRESKLYVLSRALWRLAQSTPTAHATAQGHARVA